MDRCVIENRVDLSTLTNADIAEMLSDASAYSKEIYEGKRDACLHEFLYFVG